MTQWSIWGGFMKKTRGQKSRATVPLMKSISYMTFLLIGYFPKLLAVSKQFSLIISSYRVTGFI